MAWCSHCQSNVRLTDRAVNAECPNHDNDHMVYIIGQCPECDAPMQKCPKCSGEVEDEVQETS